MRYENVLFVGTGGGNDIFSATLAILALRNRSNFGFKRCSIAGVVRPFHSYSGIEWTAQPQQMNGIVRPEGKRLLLRRDNPR